MNKVLLSKIETPRSSKNSQILKENHRNLSEQMMLVKI